MRISDWSSDVCSSDLDVGVAARAAGDALDRRRRVVPAQPPALAAHRRAQGHPVAIARLLPFDPAGAAAAAATRSEEHTSELQSLMRISYAVFCLKKKKYRKARMNPSTNSRQ